MDLVSAIIFMLWVALVMVSCRFLSSIQLPKKLIIKIFTIGESLFLEFSIDTKWLPFCVSTSPHFLPSKA